MERKFYDKNKNDWGFYVSIDIECPYIPKPSNRRDLIIINEKDKLRYYVKKHVPTITQSVILLKTAPQEFSHNILIKNDSRSLEKDSVTPFSYEMRKERISKIVASRTYIILTTLLSSTLFAFAFALALKNNYILKVDLE